MIRMALGLLLVAMAMATAGGQEPVQYSHKTLVQLFQTGELSGYPQMFNPSVAGTHRFGSPNSHFPWLYPGGVPEGKSVQTLKELILPPGGQIKVRVIAGEKPPRYQTWNKLYTWTFPKGTVAKIRLYHEGDEFARHVSTKVEDGHGISAWEGEEQIVGKVPAWYTSVDNCTKCHEDVGKHARVLRPLEDNYYYWLRGADGRFSWHPFENIDPRRMVATPLKIRSDPQIVLEE